MLFAWISKNYLFLDYINKGLYVQNFSLQVQKIVVGMDESDDKDEDGKYANL